MADTRTDPYVLGRDKAESNRLDEQHRMSVETYGYLIHPKAKNLLPLNPRIAEVAAGTGVWALHAAQALPEGACITAYDISPAQFPSYTTDNVNFVVHDAKEPFPNEDHNSFDLVHIRALVGAMQPSDWDVVMRNILQLLKPKGFVQWEEGDLSRIHCLRGSSDYYHFLALPKLLQEFRLAMGERNSATFRVLPKLAMEQLTDVELDMSSSDRIPSLRDPMSRQLISSLIGWATKARAFSEHELEELKSTIAMEVERGAYIRVDCFCLVGQKPGVTA